MPDFRKRRRLLIWTPLALLGATLFALTATTHPAGIPLAGASLAAVGLLGVIGDQEARHAA